MMCHTGATPNLPWGYEYRQEGERRSGQPITALRNYVPYVGCVGRIRDRAGRGGGGGGGGTHVLHEKNGYQRIRYTAQADSYVKIVFVLVRTES